ncbi:MAG: sulfite exporter TauE/SafE family protein [Pseudomonadota bacterium]
MIAALESWLAGSLGIGLGAAFYAFAVFFIGGVVKGGLGFGLPLVSISLLPLLLPIELALAINALILPGLNAWQARQSGRFKEVLQRFWPLALTLTLMLPVGVWLGAGLQLGTLTLFLGIFVMAFTLFQALSPKVMIPARLERPAGALTGILAGLSGGLTTINGPFFILFLVGRGADRAVLTGALGLFFIITGVMLSVSFAAFGRIQAPEVAAAIACLVPAVVGMALGNKLMALVPQALFRRIVLTALFLAGANITLRAALGG